MDQAHENENQERKELWASLQVLRPEIDKLVARKFDFSKRQRDLIALMARIIVSEIDFQAGTTGAK